MGGGTTHLEAAESLQVHACTWLACKQGGLSDLFEMVGPGMPQSGHKGSALPTNCIHSHAAWSIAWREGLHAPVVRPGWGIYDLTHTGFHKGHTSYSRFHVGIMVYTCY